MHILYATTARLDEFDAPAYHVTHTCNALVELGHRVTLLRHSGRRLVLPEYQSKCDHVSAWSPRIRGGVRLFFHLFSRALSRQLRTGRYDAVYLRISPSVGILEALKGKEVAPSFLELNGQEHVQSSVFRSGAGIFSGIFTDSERSIERAAHEWGIAANRFVLNANCGVDPAQYLAPISTEAVRRRFGLPVDAFLIAHASSFRPHHDFDMILAAASRLSFPVELVFCGDGARMTEIREKCAALGIKGHFLGALPQEVLAEVTRSCDVCVNAFVEASQRVGNFRAFKLYEYMATATPTVETIDPTGLVGDWAKACLALVPAGDSAAMAAALESIRASPEEWKARGDEARRWVFANVTWKHVAKRIVEGMERAMTPLNRSNP